MSAHSGTNGAAGPAIPSLNHEQDQEDEVSTDPEFVPKVISLRLTEGLVNRLRGAAADKNIGYQSLIKQILRTWLHGYSTGDGGPVTIANAPIEPVARPPATARPLRTRPQLLVALREAIKQQEKARADGQEDEVVRLGGEIEQIKDDLADLENEGI